jgi:hypothetical protein
MSILSKSPPIFIIGPPRSGSTLAMQVITEAFDLGYFSNYHCKNINSEKLSNNDYKKKIDHRVPSSFSSFHGDTDGETAPAECGNWWYQFFRVDPTYVTLEDVDRKKMNRFRKNIEEMTIAFGKPIIFKNLYASLRLRPICHYIPESLFIVINRNDVENGHSLLETRKKVFNNYETWWSMKPPRFSKLKKLSPPEQVIEQIRNIHITIDMDLKASGSPLSRRFDLKYEEFCEDPNKIMNAIRLWMAKNGIFMKQRNSVPTRFKQRTAIRIENSIYDQMTLYAKKF